MYVFSTQRDAVSYAVNNLSLEKVIIDFGQITVRCYADEAGADSGLWFVLPAPPYFVLCKDLCARELFLDGMDSLDPATSYAIKRFIRIFSS